MTPDNIAALRQHVVALLRGGQAFTPPAKILADVPVHARGVRIEGFGHSLWQLLEHIRVDQRDILDFCVAPVYTELRMPDDMWPEDPAPPSEEAWDRSVATFLAELEEAKGYALDESIDLFSIVLHGTTHTWLRELLLIADHNGHHLGQFIAVRKILGVWQP